MPGTLLANRYRIVSMLGKGGMGEVYRADDLTLGQSVALKFLPDALLHNEDALRRFRNEVRTARQVSHPNVCRVHDVGEVDDQIFLSMEYVDGEDLSSLLRRIGRLPEDKALEIARKLCAGLAAAHERGVLHRDIKPSNVMLDGRGQVLLTDFGLAGIAEQIAGVEIRSGTPAYMAPEQMQGKEVTVRSDIYSLGLVLYELFTGKRPFEGESVAELMRARLETTPSGLSSHVRDLDPSVERVIMRCLETDPSRRPASALAVSAGLPGGDPLAAALAAGETPSPELVAAAGEGSGLSVKYALPLFVILIAGILGHAVWSERSTAHARLGTVYSPEVLEHKARELLNKLAINDPAADSQGGLSWDYGYIGHLRFTRNAGLDWNQILSGRPSVLRFWYRESADPLIEAEFHDDLMTPGVVDFRSPPPIRAGMKLIELDKQGRLLSLHRVPPERNDKPQPPAAVDWAPFFAAAEIDQAQLTPATPQWAWLEAADTRLAWTGVWPGTQQAMRVEAASWQGKAVVFSLQNPGTGPWRSPRDRSMMSRVSVTLIWSTILIVICGAVIMARRNVMRGKGDRRGALRLGVFIFCVQMLLWLARSHFVASIGTFRIMIIALCTSVFYGVVIWTLYMAIEPYVRREWPQTIIAWTRVLSGRLRDPIVGRDILIGAALSLVWRTIAHVQDMLPSRGGAPDLVSLGHLFGFRSAIAECLETVPHAVRETLTFFFIIFLLRVVLRKHWLAAAAFVIVFGWANYGGRADPVQLIGSILVIATLAFVVLRFGLLALAVGIFIDGVIGDMPVTFDPSMWYFPMFILMLAGILALVTWGFKETIAGQKWFGSSLLD